MGAFMDYPPLHWYDSDGQCKGCGVMRGREADQFCDLDNMAEFVEESSPASEGNVLGFILWASYSPYGGNGK